MKRKIYNKLIDWKNKANGKNALLIEGARRVGKSYITEEFAKNEYQSYILIDFNREGKQLRDIFENYINDLDTFFMYLSAYFGKNFTRETLLLFLMKFRFFQEKELQLNILLKMDDTII